MKLAELRQLADRLRQLDDVVLRSVQLAEIGQSSDRFRQRQQAIVGDAKLNQRAHVADGYAYYCGQAAGRSDQWSDANEKGATDKKYEEVQWPAVTRHPVTGRSILFVNPMHTHGFVGMKREEAWPLIEELAAHSTQERFVYYHRWRVGDVLIWDERATMHRGAGDYRPDERRIMLRTIVYPN